MADDQSKTTACPCGAPPGAVCKKLDCPMLLKTTGIKPCFACNGRGEQCGPGGEMECRECDGLGTLPVIAPRPLVPGKSVRAATPPASTCIEHAYGTTTRLSFQIKVF